MDIRDLDEVMCDERCNEPAGGKSGLCDFHYKFSNLSSEQKQIALVAARRNPTCGYVTVGHIGNPAQFCGKPATHFHLWNEVRTKGSSPVALASAFWLCDEHEAREPQNMETKMGLWEEL